MLGPTSNRELPIPLPRTSSPPYRELRVYAVDPALARRANDFDVAHAIVKIRWDDLVGPGPEGKYVDVIDFDPSSGCFYTPADLDQPTVLATKGLTPTESDPRFHGQMVYAVVMNTIQAFEAALGRQIHWPPHLIRNKNGQVIGDEVVEKLRIYPHALRGENAYYDPERQALLFGYFPARDASGTGTGGLVFSCLSFDIVTHETTHAILDSLYTGYTEDTNPDVLAFHEAFADIVALFSHFGLPDFLRHQIAGARGDIDSNNLLAQIAVEFGKGIGKHGALRDAIGSLDENGVWKRTDPRERPLSKRTEPHDRGSVLVAAVFDAFLKIYRRRSVDLMRLASDGTGVLKQGAIAPDLVGRLVDEAAKAARHVQSICIRALDYLPPVDVTFHEYLRALITADFDAAPDDPLGYRVAFIEAFENWGILPSDATPLGENSLRWQRLDEQVVIPAHSDIADWNSRVRMAMLDGMDLYRRLFGVPDASLIDCDMERYKPFYRLREELKSGMGSERRRVYLWSQDMARILHGFFQELGRHRTEPANGDGSLAVLARLFGIVPDEADERGRHPRRPFEVSAVRLLRRPSIDPLVLPRPEVIIVLRQRIWIDPTSLGESPKVGEGLRFRGGSTLIYDFERGVFRFVIRKDVNSQVRRASQRDYQADSPRPLYFAETRQPFRMLHEEDF